MTPAPELTRELPLEPTRELTPQQATRPAWTR